MASYIRRRKFLAMLGGGAVAWPLPARAQQAMRQPTVPVVGFLDAGSAGERTLMVARFRQGLAEAGFVDGQNVIIEFRWADSQYDRMPDYTRSGGHRRACEPD